MMRSLCLAVLAAALVTVPAVAAADVTLKVLDHPDVVVTTGYEGENFTTPRYLWSPEIRVTNGDQARQVTLHAVTYFDRSITDCPEQRQGVRPVHLFGKSRQLEPRQTVVLGGLAQQEPSGHDRYWPMEVYRAYPTPDGDARQYEAGQHTFCVLVMVTGSDPACDKTETRTCTLAKAPFRAHVRRTNEAPQVTELSITPETPRPGQLVLLQAKAVDNDTEPRPDQITYRWDLGPDEEQGAVVRHRFSTPGTYSVELTVSDGFEEVTIERNVTVAGAGVGGGGGGENGAPAPGLAAMAALLATLALARSHSRR